MKDVIKQACKEAVIQLIILLYCIIVVSISICAFVLIVSYYWLYGIPLLFLALGGAYFGFTLYDIGVEKGIIK